MEMKKEKILKYNSNKSTAYHMVNLKIWVLELGKLWKHVVNRFNPNEFCKKKLVRYWYDNILTTY